ncbi:histone deacetylase family protein [Breoghania sp.]|uniref:histone deacetylase family protein n=1 Tax=Breoghania sp. TaxID=2065378 RepID=UPI002AAB7BA9|nr:histone deacetylase family protein [Breoghania sp.]
MATLLLHHSSFLDHHTPLGHPERPDRMRAVDRILEHERFQTLERDAAPMASLEAVILAHPERHVENVRKHVPEQGLARIDGDTTVSPGSWDAALRAVGAGCRAVDEVMEGKVQNAFCAIRPPGHHAEYDKPMGFCLFNNIAIAARHAQKTHGAERVAIVDFDVHHGNGTQDIFWNDPSVMYCSTHQMPLFPGTGSASETGAGTIVNAPLMAGDGSEQFKEAVEIMLLPRLAAFKPDLLLISAGFDAHRRDPLANINLVEEDFAWITAKLMDIADTSCNGRVVSMLEGGYDLEGLARSVAAHVMTLMDS